MSDGKRTVIVVALFLALGGLAGAKLYRGSWARVGPYFLTSYHFSRKTGHQVRVEHLKEKRLRFRLSLLKGLKDQEKEVANLFDELLTQCRTYFDPKEITHVELHVVSAADILKGEKDGKVFAAPLIPPASREVASKPGPQN